MIGGSKGWGRQGRIRSQNFFISMQFSGKLDENSRPPTHPPPPPRLGNLKSATDDICTCHCIYAFHDIQVLQM